MNIDQYKHSMNEIPMRIITADELSERLNKRTKKMVPNKPVAAFLMLCIMIGFVCYFPSPVKHNSDISITAYAAEQEALLTEEYIRFNLTASPVDGGYSLDERGTKYNSYVNCNLNFLCEGDNIETLTYTCSDQNTNRANRFSASAYYVDNLNLPIKEYGNKIKDPDSLYGYYGEGEKTAHLTKLIGNSYSVDYDDQKNLKYGLVVAADIDEDNNYRIKDVIIKLDITLKNGSVQHKRIKIEAVKNAFSEIKIRVL